MLIVVNGSEQLHKVVTWRFSQDALPEVNTEEIEKVVKQGTRTKKLPTLLGHGTSVQAGIGICLDGKVRVPAHKITDPKKIGLGFCMYSRGNHNKRNIPEF